MKRFLQTWEWAILFDPTFTAAKKNKKAGKSALDRLGLLEQLLVDGAQTDEECLPVQHPDHLPVVQSEPSVSSGFRGPFFGSNPT